MRKAAGSSHIMREVAEGEAVAFWLLACLALSFTFFFSFSGLRDRGLINWDEPYYLRNAQFGVSAIRNIPFLVNQFQKSELDLAAFEDRLEGGPVSNPKPGHAALLTLFGLASGGIKDHSGSFFSGIFGVLTVLLVVVAGSCVYGVQTGILSAVVLSVSPYFFLYARSAMPETDSSFFFLLGILLYHLGSKSASRRSWFLFACGLCLGLSASMNYRWLFICPVVFLLEFPVYVELIRRCDPVGLLRRLSAPVLGLLCFPVLFQLPHVLLDSYQALPFPSYWDMLADAYVNRAFDGPGPPVYPHLLFVRLLWDLLGPVGFLCAVGGITISVYRHRLEDLSVLLPFAIPFVAFSLKARGDKAVAISVTIPFIAILMGRCLSYLYRRLSAMKVTRARVMANATLALLLVLITVPQVVTSYRLICIRSGYRSALGWLTENGGEKHFTTAISISNFYVGGRDRARRFPDTPEQLRHIAKGGYRYLLVDWRERDRLSQFGHNIIAEREPVFSIDNPLTRFWPYIIDDFHYRHDEPGFVESIGKSGLDRILIYDVSDYSQQDGDS